MKDKPHKLAYFDVETTGTSVDHHGLIQLAIIIEADGAVVAEREFFARPQPYHFIDAGALAITRRQLDQVRLLPEPAFMLKELQSWLANYVNKFDKNDKLTPVAYNGHFDVDFLRRFFLNCGDNYYGSWFNSHLVDPLSALHYLLERRPWKDVAEDHPLWKDLGKKLACLPNHKLATVCEAFDIELSPEKAHDALADIRATRMLYRILTDWELQVAYGKQ